MEIILLSIFPTLAVIGIWLLARRYFRHYDDITETEIRKAFAPEIADLLICGKEPEVWSYADQLKLKKVLQEAVEMKEEVVTW
jgi:hypothetical protein